MRAALYCRVPNRNHSPQRHGLREHSNPVDEQQRQRKSGRRQIDHTINANNSVWYRFQQDTGLQAAYTDPINPIFNAYSPQPQRTLVLGYTRVLTPNVVNQFTLA